MELLVDSSASFGQVVIGALDEVFGALESERFLHGGASGIHQALGCHIDQVKRIKAAARFANMPGLQWVCSLIERNLITFYNQNRLLSEDENSLLGEWPELLASYALNQSDCKIDALTRYVAASTWPTPLAAADVEEMRHLLACDPMEATQDNDESKGLFLVPSTSSVDRNASPATAIHFLPNVVNLEGVSRGASEKLPVSWEAAHRRRFASRVRPATSAGCRVCRD